MGELGMAVRFVFNVPGQVREREKFVYVGMFRGRTEDLRFWESRLIVQGRRECTVKGLILRSRC